MVEEREGFGPPDRASLIAVRDTFCRHEPLVESMAFDSPLDPQLFAVELSAGFDEPGRFDVRWSVTDSHCFHYSEPELDFRFDNHPNPHSPRKHFHPPPDAESAEPSCIEVELAERMTLAVIQCWRKAWENDDPSLLNTVENIFVKRKISVR